MNPKKHNLKKRCQFFVNSDIFCQFGYCLSIWTLFFCSGNTPFLTFFSYKCELVKCSCLVFCKAKKKFLWIQKLICCNSHGRNFWIFFHMLSNQHITRSSGYMYLKILFFQNLVLVLEMTVWSSFYENVVIVLKELQG